MTKDSLKSLAKPTAIAALGVVYGDIGTSPLYALKGCFSGEYAMPVNFENVTGILSLVFWALTWIVSIKYLTVLMRADNNGEGGIMALIALLTPKRKAGRKHTVTQSQIILLGLFGAALLYGDGMITPAVSVLSAVEGLNIATPFFSPFIVPLTVAILILLFMVQKRGTQKVGALFGPIMLLWFLAIAAISVPWLLQHPQVFVALNPWLAVQFLLHHGVHGVLVLTAVVLCVTGAEALYADMGHFGRGPIHKAWYLVVYPSLILNYFGQGALLLSNVPGTTESPFFSLVPHLFVIPMVVLATCATVIASQALISGAFSMTQQAMLLGYLPRFKIYHTSESTEGQIYIPKINFFLLVSCVILVLAFESSDKLTGAYGIAVTGTMLITSLLFYQVSLQRWQWPVWKSFSLTSLFVIVDLAMLLPNVTKILHGGWVPVVAAVAIFIAMTTWSRGQQIMFEIKLKRSMSVDDFLKKLEQEKPPRVEGASLFLTSDLTRVPVDLINNYHHNKVIHQKVILLNITTEHVPRTFDEDHGKIKELGNGFYVVRASFGFMERIHINDILGSCDSIEMPTMPTEIHFYLSRDILRSYGDTKMLTWRKDLYAFMNLNSPPIMELIGVNPSWVIETGGLIYF